MPHCSHLVLKNKCFLSNHSNVKTRGWDARYFNQTLWGGLSKEHKIKEWDLFFIRNSKTIKTRPDGCRNCTNKWHNWDEVMHIIKTSRTQHIQSLLTSNRHSRKIKTPQSTCSSHVHMRTFISLSFCFQNSSTRRQRNISATAGDRRAAPVQRMTRPPAVENTQNHTPRKQWGTIEPNRKHMDRKNLASPPSLALWPLASSAVGCPRC